MTRDGWRAEDRFAEFVLADELTFFTADVDDLAGSLFVEHDHVFAGDDGCRTERSGQPQPPQKVAGRHIRGLQNTGAIDDVNTAVDDDGTRRRRAEFVVVPQNVRRVAVARAQNGQTVRGNEDVIAQTEGTR